MIKLETKSYINRVGAKISALSLGIIDKYEYLTGDKLLPPQQHRIIQEAKFSYSPLRKTFEKQTKTIENHGQKQVEALHFLKPNEWQIQVYQPQMKSVEDIFP